MDADCFCDYEPAVFYSKRQIKAQIIHRCHECGKAILPGENYEYVAAKWFDFGMDTFKTCSRCHYLRQWVMNNIPCFCWAHGNMLDDAKEAVDDAWCRAPDETVGLRFGFLRRLHRVQDTSRAWPPNNIR